MLDTANETGSPPAPAKRIYRLQMPGGGSDDYYWHNANSFGSLGRRVKKLAREIAKTGDIPNAEILLMRRHIESSSSCRENFPGIFLIKWLRAMIDGNDVIDPLLRPQFLEAIVSINKGPTTEIEDSEEKVSIVIIDGVPRLQYDDTPSVPEFDFPDTLDFKDRFFCFSGKFSFGTRTQCEAQVAQRLGKLSRRPVLSTDYLIIGSLGGYGAKVDEVNELKRRGSLVRIVPEEHWVKFL